MSGPIHTGPDRSWNGMKNSRNFRIFDFAVFNLHHVCIICLLLRNQAAWKSAAVVCCWNCSARTDLQTSIPDQDRKLKYFKCFLKKIFKISVPDCPSSSVIYKIRDRRTFSDWLVRLGPSDGRSWIGIFTTRNRVRRHGPVLLKLGLPWTLNPYCTKKWESRNFKEV